jgi:hypothetical protein
LDYDEEEDSMTHQIMTFWFKHQLKLIHDYSLVGYVLSPHPRIMNDARERMRDSPIYSDAVERLIGKLLLPENSTSTKHKTSLLLPVVGTILGRYQEPKYLENWLAWFYQKN